MTTSSRTTLAADSLTSMAVIVQLAALYRYIALGQWRLAYLAADKLDGLMSQIARPA